MGSWHITWSNQTHNRPSTRPGASSAPIFSVLLMLALCGGAIGSPLPSALTSRLSAEAPEAHQIVTLVSRPFRWTGLCCAASLHEESTPLATSSCQSAQLAVLHGWL